MVVGQFIRREVIFCSDIEKNYKEILSSQKNAI